MTGYEFGDIVLVPFPFTDQSTTKRRPAAIVSSATYHRRRPDLIILAITSQVRRQAAFAEAEVSGWKEAGLLRPSVFKPVLTTIESGLVIRKLGRLQAQDRASLSDLLAMVLGS